MLFTAATGSVLAFLVILLIVGSAAAACEPDTEYVRESGDLVAALLNPCIVKIVFSNYSVGDELAGHVKQLKLARNLTVLGQNGTAVVNLSYQQRQLHLCSTCRLTFMNITLANDRWGSGTMLDLVSGSAGSTVELQNVVLQRTACISPKALGAQMDSTPRSMRYPSRDGKQHWGVRSLEFQGHTYNNQLSIADWAPRNPVTPKGKAVGYDLWARNVSMLCMNIVSDQCLASKPADECVTDMLAQLGAGQERKPAPVALIAGIVTPVAVIAMLASMAVFVWAMRRRRLQRRQQMLHKGGKAEPEAVDLSLPELQSFGSEIPSVVDNGLFPLELRPSARFRSSQQSERRDSGGSFKSCAPMGCSKGWQMTNYSTTPMPGLLEGDASCVEFLELLGAGSFGRVFRGFWCGREVAVKVIEHISNAAVSDVEREAELLLHFNHPNVIRCYGYVTYTQQDRGISRQDSVNAMSVQERMHQELQRLNQAQQERSMSLPGSQRFSLYRESQSLADTAAGGASGAANSSKHSPQQSIRHSAPSGNLSCASASSSRFCTVDSTADESGEAPGQVSGQLGQQGEQEQQPASSDVLMLPGLVQPASSATSSSLSQRQQREQQERRTPSGTDTVSTEVVLIGTASAGTGSTALTSTRPSFSVNFRRAETWLICEFADCGTLQQVGHQLWGDPSREGDEQMLARLLLLRDTAQGLAALHAKGVVHGDMNASNVLVASSPTAPFINMVAKVSDLGLARVIKQHETHRTTQTVGTLSHMAPEVLQHGRMSQAADVYAFGILLHQTYTGRPAFEKLVQYGQFFEAVVLHNLRPMLVKGMPADYEMLMQSCWRSDPSQRPSAARLVERLEMLIRDRQACLISRVNGGSGASRPPGPGLAAAPASAHHHSAPLTISEQTEDEAERGGELQQAYTRRSSMHVEAAVPASGRQGLAAGSDLSGVAQAAAGAAADGVADRLDSLPDMAGIGGMIGQLHPYDPHHQHHLWVV